jgi:hypothetical protein
MYNRLTIVDNLSDKQAKLKIITDHKHLLGFSGRNIRRYLPSNNPQVPHRVRTSWPKNSIAKAGTNPILSVNEHSETEGNDVPRRSKNAVDGGRRPIVDEEALKPGDIFTSLNSNTSSHTDYDCSGCKELTTENRELKDALSKTTAFPTANDTYISSQVPDTLDFEVSFLFSELASHMTKLNEKDEVWVSGKINKNNQRVISHRIGRLEQINSKSDIKNG